MLKKLGSFFYPSQPHHESGAATGLYLCGSDYRFTLCGNAHAHVSKYGGKFFKMKKTYDKILKKSQGSSFHSGRDVGGPFNYQRTSLALCAQFDQAKGCSE